MCSYIARYTISNNYSSPFDNNNHDKGSFSQTEPVQGNPMNDDDGGQKGPVEADDGTRINNAAIPYSFHFRTKTSNLQMNIYFCRSSKKKTHKI